MLESATDKSGTTYYAYDIMNGLTDVTLPDGTVIHYDYDNLSRLTRISTPYGATAYEYDILDRLVRVIDRNGYATVYEYDANGNRTAVRYANGITTTYEYDELNRLIREETLDKDNNVMAQYIYTLGLAGERVSVAELDRTVEYAYDELYRLTSETVTEGNDITAYAYEYDNVSNRTLKTENGVTTVYAYNELNQLISENNATYEYDLNGNLVKMVTSDKSALYIYDANNRLVEATVQMGNNVVVESYGYDYAGNRTSKTTTTNGKVEFTKYLLDVNTSLTQVLVEIDGDGGELAYTNIRLNS